MKSTRIVSIALLLFIHLTSSSQTIRGKVSGYFGEEKEALTGAVVYYINSDVAATTDENGWFQIDFMLKRLLVVQYIGFKPDTIRTIEPVYLDITLQPEDALEEIELVERIKSTELNSKAANLEFQIGQKELAKAACCNLSESFETNPAIDASFADAVTGTRQIELLGLAGKYSQIQLEMVPYVRGVSSNYGLTHIPGPWISSMQLSKGAGSVTNGFESMTGQINVELHKPENGPKLLINAYGNGSGRAELNVITAQTISPRWSTILMVHGSGRFQKNDNNSDGFLDMPLSRQLNLYNKWKYVGPNGLRTQIGVRVLNDEMRGGQLDFDHNDPESQSAWGSSIKNERYELFGKIGYVVPNQNLSSLGFIYSIYQHNLFSYFGNNRHNTYQTSGYFNLMYQSILGSSEHTYKVGVSLMYDRYNRSNSYVWQGINEGFPTENMIINYATPGAYIEYTWNPSEQFSLIAGIRGDKSNTALVEDFMVSPRLHLRYSPFEKTTFRLGVGKGYRMPQVMEENLSILASSRKPTDPEFSAAYVENSFESAWNLGLSFVQNFKLNYRDGAIVVDYFYTHFNRQMVRDMDYGPQQFDFYMLENGSSSSTISAQIDYEPLKRLDVRLAYKYQLVETDFRSIGRAMNPLIPQNRVLFNLGYSTRNKWKFDATLNWYDSKRIPSTESNPIEYQFPTSSESFSMIHFQINKELGKFEVYVGGENMLDFRQNDAIIDPEHPFGQYFDSNLIWGPIFGRMFYAGVNFKL